MRSSLDVVMNVPWLTVLFVVNGTFQNVLTAKPQGADEETLTQIAHFLPYLQPRDLSVIGITIHETWITGDAKPISSHVGKCGVCFSGIHPAV